MRNASEKKCRKNYNMCYTHEIMWKNIVQPDIPQLIIPYVHFAHWIIKAKKQTHMHNI